MSYGINAFLYSKVVWGRIFPNTQKLVCSPWMRFSRPSTSLGEHMASFCCRKDFTISWKWHGLSSERVLLGGGGGGCCLVCLFVVCVYGSGFVRCHSCAPLFTWRCGKFETPCLPSKWIFYLSFSSFWH